MNKSDLLAYLERLDRALKAPATLYIYGSATGILLDEPGRTSLALDVAGPYSEADEGDLRRAADEAGLPVNPAESYDRDHIEWVGPLRLCMPPPVTSETITLWQGARLRVQTGSMAALIASKLIRYDETDRSDIQYLLAQSRASFADISAATKLLPPPFSRDHVVLENLENLRADMAVWGDLGNDRT